MTTLVKTIIIILSPLLTNCSSKQADKEPSESTYSRSVDSLQNYINLKTYKPVNVMWRISQQGINNSSRLTVPGPSDYKLEAFIQFDRATADKLKKDYNLNSNTTQKISTNEYWFAWLPNMLKMKDKLDSSQVYEITPFAKAPLINGKYVFISVNTILIKLYTT